MFHDKQCWAQKLPHKMYTIDISGPKRNDLCLLSYPLSKTLYFLSIKVGFLESEFHGFHLMLQNYLLRFISQ